MYKTIKQLLFFQALLLSLFSLSCNNNSILSNTAIIENGKGILIDCDYKLLSDFNASVADFKQQLSKVTGEKHVNSSQIILSNKAKYIDSKTYASLEKSRQAFHIAAQSNKIVIVARYQEGIRNGMYWYLGQLGYRWYFPGDLWTKEASPRRDFISLNKTVKPDFANRSFMGGGGFPNKHPGDPNGIVREEWTKWSNRNLFGTEVKPQGHAWQDFVKRNKAILLQHPEYLAEPLNAKKPVLRTKLCVSNEKLVNLFVEDRKKKLEETILKYGKNHLESTSIAAEPSDGGGHCTCTNCQKLGSVSNRVFHLANRTAEALESEFPDVKVALLAYNEHSAPPTFPLHKNVFVTIVPYGFQHETMPEKFMEQWSQKTDNIQAYEYWGILVSRKGKPVQNFLERPGKELKLLKDNNINGIRIESTYSIGAAGISLYLLSKLAFDTSLNSTNLTEELLEDCFGGGKEIMQNMLTRWSSRDFIPQIERSILEKEFASADKAANSAEQRERIAAFKKYATFLLYADDVERAKKDKVKVRKELKKMTDYSWSILPDLMVHSYWISNPFVRIYDKESYRGYVKREREKSTTYFSGLRQKKYPSPFKSNSEILLKDNIRSVQRAEAVLKDARKIQNSGKRTASNNKVLIKPAKGFSMEYYADNAHDLAFSFSSKVINPKRVGTAFIIGLYERDKLIWTKTYKDATERGTGTLPFPKKGNYTIKAKMPNVKLDLNWHDKGNTFFRCGTPIKVPEYYYQPLETQKELLFTTKGKVRAFNENGGELVLETLDKNIYKINLANKQIEEIKFKSSLIIDILNADNCLFYLK
jgi:hypothetical protein